MSDRAQYCRDIETYLCRKNEGHLIRIVGPAFEQVCGWAARGVPLKVAFKGIDRYCERYYAKGGRRRAVRIEFCEADVLDAFDEWRRAIGVVASGTEAGADAGAASGRRPPLAAHIERGAALLRSLGEAASRSPEFLRRIRAVVDELEALAGEARSARGENRARLVERLASLDAAMLDASLRELDPARAGALRQEAETELAPFGGRMPSEARERALAAAYHRLVREAVGMPTLRYE